MKNPIVSQFSAAVAATVTVFSTVVGFSGVALAQPVPTLTTQDIYYLADLYRLLMRNKLYDFTPLVENIPHEEKIKVAKKVCQELKNGVSGKELTLSLIAITENNSDLTAQQKDMLQKYMFTVWIVGVDSYCPEYRNQLSL